MSDARNVAARTLQKVTSDGAYSNLVLNTALKENNLSGEDKAFCTALFYGTLDRMVTVDFFLKKLIKTPIKKLKPFTLAVLRTAVYQIKYMDKVPDSAAVNEAVKLIKASSEAFNASFVNGVLRNLLRTEIPLPTGNSIYDISVETSCPGWIVSVLLNDYGATFTRNFLLSANTTPPLFLRVNTAKTNKEALKKLFSEQNADCLETDVENCLELKVKGSVEELEAYEQGLFFVQDVSCQRAVEMLQIGETDRILDLCAAPGGKSFTAAGIAKKGEIVACDLYEQRVGLIKSGSERLGLKNIVTKVADASVFDEKLGLFDKIICDVPCSGLGVIRRKPDIKLKQPDSFEELAELQLKILTNAAKYLKKEGRLLYSTCTLNKLENRANVDRFLSQNNGFELLNDKTFTPMEDGSDGFYAAVIRKL